MLNEPDQVPGRLPEDTSVSNALDQSPIVINDIQ